MSYPLHQNLPIGGFKPMVKLPANLPEDHMNSLLKSLQLKSQKAGPQGESHHYELVAEKPIIAVLAQNEAS